MQPKIIDITTNKQYEKYLDDCLPIRFRKFMDEYLKDPIPNGLHKKILIWNNGVVGQIEYSPAEVSSLPIKGDRVFVLNCIWVLRRAKGNNFGRILLGDTIRSIKDKAFGLATIALENHPSNWLKKWHLEYLGFSPIDSIEIRHKTKYGGKKFRVYLMWLPVKKDADPLIWNIKDLLKGVKFCSGHPLYHPESLKMEEIFEIIDERTS